MNQAFSPGTAAAPTSLVEVSISCRNLLDMDFLSKSDPMCVVYNQPAGSAHWVEMMRTETLKDTLNPDFASKITLEYRFEESQMLRFELYDIDSPSQYLGDHDFLGSAESSLGQIVSAGSNGHEMELEHPRFLTESPGKVKKAGIVILTAEELSSLKDEVTFKVSGMDIGTVSCCFLPQIFYVVSKVNEKGKYVVVHRSESNSGPDPTWKPITLSVCSLCNGDPDRSLRFECYKSKRNGSHQLMGYCLLTLNKMVKQGTGGTKLKSPTDEDSNATLAITHCRITPIYTFIDYIQSGTKIHCCFAIDFTSSNGDPNDPSSLHFFAQSESKINPYEQAILAVGDIIKDYDTTNTFLVHGFGARIPPFGCVSHNFQITLDKSPYCFGIQGVIETYRSCIRQIQLYGPTNFAPVINRLAAQAAEQQNGEHYYVLVIITDGVITDMPSTKEAIVKASRLPLSIIIVGVGGADFDAMEELDGDSVRISSDGIEAARDIVQFVPYRDAYSWMAATVGPGKSETNPYPAEPGVTKGNTDATQRMAQAKLAQEVLAEIPDQLTSFMKSRGIFPSRPHSASSLAQKFG